MTALFSIVIPIYKVEEFVRKCIDSATNQTYRNIEIILVDDGSPDSSPAICDEYAAKDGRVKIIHKENGGIVSARQAGVSVATGEYIINLDGDDYMSLDYCEKMAHIIEQNHPEIVMCGHYKKYADEEELCQLSYRKGLYNRRDLEQEVFPILLQDKYGHSFALSLWAKAIKSSIQKEQQKLIDTRITIGDDSVCVAPCIFYSNSIYIMEECLYYYRQNYSSITKSRIVYSWDGPELRAKHLERQLDMSVFNLQEQLYRSVTHSLFTVARSQFNDSTRSNREIKRDISKMLKKSYYADAIKKSKFKGIKANMMKYALQYKLLWAVQIFNSRR